MRTDLSERSAALRAARVPFVRARVILAEAPTRIKEWISFELDAGFVIEVILVGFKAREKVKLAFDLAFGG